MQKAQVETRALVTLRCVCFWCSASAKQKEQEKGKAKECGPANGVRCQWGQSIETAPGLKVCSEKWSWVSAGLNGPQGEELLRSQEALSVVWLL